MSKSYKARVNPQPKILLAVCIDVRFANAFEEFSKKELGVKRKRDVIMRLAGGLTPIAFPKEMPSRFKYLRKQLIFKCKKFPSIEKVIAVVHENCAYWDTVPQSVLNYQCDGEDGLEKSTLPLIGSFLEAILPGKKVELYHAKFIGKKRRRIAFDLVACGPRERAISDMEKWDKEKQRTKNP